MNPAEDFLKRKLQERQQAGNYRELKPENSRVDFCSNDYLGFARSLVLKQSIAQEVNTNPLSLNGAAGSRLLSGNIRYAEDLENQIADYHQSEAGLLFNSGYDANLGLLSSLAQRGDTIILDELVHASIIDGARLSYANRYSFRHNDLESLEAKLKLAKGNCYVVIESVYSMDGDTPPLTQILNLTEKHNAALIVDEAHAVGLYPRGLVCELGLQQRIFARIITFGKALGSHGAVVLGSNTLRKYLINFARSFIYTTAAPFHQLAAIKMAYQLLEDSREATISLKKNIDLFKQQVNTGKNFTLLNSDSAIQCIVLKSNEMAREAAKQLQMNNFDVRPILSPTIAQGTERIRICLHSFNTENELTLLAVTLNKFILLHA
ncbi:8-amino-7-oxononanoate synthase [Mucilaginibacter rubeus]|uniref:8-amino-7-oxononanoate synthase n=1 Tax=Mucilaginibacter rubeus TaxID=2027860 RepID=A0AAE6JCN4_9SPHI|nr:MULTISPECIES: 8-amino-7-oxononanoate synthase [Mucilaginibacter]QEM03222.1 8-amino-7-oxononanoate synthase [Mucilaginibacter rubeus]QEM15840.1 8-amino-7-oxononanoate synthase [Mucilaginibacter gossypii]QTE41421.1 8-amino-7-oxononanoate synthase [Mucilaginibacter rubeus]QTE48024.1 8-amino-7-oxononanoate synthase [Mucilaginibacter rubeus]QTE59418.1 8-amino-7-oxononanoate synthase [Mucilaginibacter rubeus]